MNLKYESVKFFDIGQKVWIPRFPRKGASDDEFDMVEGTVVEQTEDTSVRVQFEKRRVVKLRSCYCYSSRGEAVAEFETALTRSLDEAKAEQEKLNKQIRVWTNVLNLVQKLKQ